MSSLASYAQDHNDRGVLADTRAFQAYLALAGGQKAEAVRIAASCQRGDGHTAPMPTFHVADLSLAKVLLGVGTPAALDEARAILSRVRTAAEKTHNTRFLIEARALQGLLLRSEGNEPAALAAVRHAVELAQPGGAQRVFLDLGPRMADLLQELRRQGVASDYLDLLLRARARSAASGVGPEHEALIEPLSPRELEVLVLLSQRWSNKEIGRKLGISDHTVKRHTMNIYQKLLVQNRRQAVERATALGILPVAQKSPP